MSSTGDGAPGTGLGSWPLVVVLLGLLGGFTVSRSTPVSVTELSPVPVGVEENRVSDTPSLEAAELLQELLTVPPDLAVAPADCELGSSAEALVCAAEHKRATVRFLIAMVPDYVDSNVRWTFDGNADAIQRAAAADGYTLYRFWLPDWPLVQGGATDDLRSARRVHEHEPGLAVFVRTRARDEHDVLLPFPEIDVLAVFLVAETPTNGIHDRAFLKAARYILDWSQVAQERAVAEPGDADAEPYTLRILGPNYSGAAPSLRRALDALVTGHQVPSLTVRVISGTATGSANPDLLEFEYPLSVTAPATVRVTFNATVRSDPDMLRALCEHLVERGSLQKFALLVESNTGYGQGFRPQGSGISASPSDSCQQPFATAPRLPFPLHISRLREAAGHERDETDLPRAASVGLDLGHDERVTDQLPSITPELTSATVELTLQNILDTIRRERFDAVGILATDKRDHLFLAERIVREAPNTLLFSTEADLIYLHPDFRAFTRGSLIATTYPLFNATQTLTNSALAAAGRHQFPTQGAQGIYNAMLAQLGQERLMLDYAPPGVLDRFRSEACGDARSSGVGDDADATGLIPPIWISVVGQQSLWPLDVRPVIDPPGDGSSQGYTLPVSPCALSGGGASSMRPSTSLGQASLAVTAVGMLLFAVFVLHVVTYLLAHHSLAFHHSWKWTRRFQYTPVVRILHLHSWSADLRSVGLEHRLFLGLILLLMWLTALFVSRLTRASFRADSTFATVEATGDSASGSGVWAWPEFLPHPLEVVSILFVVIVVVSAVRAMSARRPQSLEPRSSAWGTVWNVLSLGSEFPRYWGWLLGCVSTIMPLGLGLVAGLDFLRFLFDRVWNAAPNDTLAFARTTNPSNWVSPVAPVLLLGVGLYIWLVWHMRQLAVGGTSYRAESQIFRVMTGRDRELAEHLQTVLTSAWRREHGGTLLIPLATFVAYVLYVPVWYTPDGSSFGVYLWWGSCLVILVIAHVLAQTLHLWLLFVRVLRHLRQHRLGDVIRDVAKEPMTWSLSLTPPRLGELKLITRRTRRLSQLLDRVATDALLIPKTDGERERRVASSVGEEPVVTDRAAKLAGALRTRRTDVQRLLNVSRGEAHALLEVEMRRAHRRPFLESATWGWLVRLSDRLVDLLRYGAWLRHSDDLAQHVRDWYHEAELVVGLQIAFIVRDILSRIVSGMTMAILGSTLILCSHLFYSWPGRAAMLAIDWGVLVATVAVVGFMLVRLEKDPVLSRLWSTSEGRVSFTGGFFYRMAIYAALPIVTLFAWQFPEVGGSIFSWLEPLQKAMP